MSEAPVPAKKDTVSSQERALSDVNHILIALADEMGVDHSDLDLFLL